MESTTPTLNSKTRGIGKATSQITPDIKIKEQKQTIDLSKSRTNSTHSQSKHKSKQTEQNK